MELLREGDSRALFLRAARGGSGGGVVDEADSEMADHGGGGGGFKAGSADGAHIEFNYLRSGA